MEKLERYLRFIREAERLKDVLRTAHTSRMNSSVPTSPYYNNVRFGIQRYDMSD